MRAIYQIDEDKGYPYWRLSIDVINSQIRIKVENYKWGFLSGEEWDKIFVYNRDSFVSYDASYLVSLMTRFSYEYLMSRYDEVLQRFYTNLFDIENSNNQKFKKEKEMYNSSINKINNIRSSDVFKNIKREKRIKELLDDK